MLCRNEIEYTVFDLSTQKTGYRWIISINEQAFMATINDRTIFANATRSFHLIINSAVTNDVYQTIHRVLLSFTGNRRVFSARPTYFELPDIVRFRLFLRRFRYHFAIFHRDGLSSERVL